MNWFACRHIWDNTNRPCCTTRRLLLSLDIETCCCMENTGKVLRLRFIDRSSPSPLSHTFSHLLLPSFTLLHLHGFVGVLEMTHYLFNECLGSVKHSLRKSCSRPSEHHWDRRRGRWSGEVGHFLPDFTILLFFGAVGGGGRSIGRGCSTRSSSYLTVTWRGTATL